MTKIDEYVPSVNQGGAWEVFRAFLKLGLTSFGGPVAHLGYFRDELVVKRRWLEETEYADIVALCQFLPGPASSKVGLCLGLLRGGPLGAFAAWFAFTMPSAILLVSLAFWASLLGGPIGIGLIHGLKIVAVAIVAQAVWGMARTLAPDRERATIALAAVIVVSTLGAVGQIAAIILGLAFGLVFCRTDTVEDRKPTLLHVSRFTGLVCFLLFGALLILLPILAATSGLHVISMFDAFFRSGAFVFGGGHVVLPLLQAETVATGWVSQDTFLTGYAAAQAVPGPLFTFAGFLGAASHLEPSGLVGAVVALVAIFMPGFLLLIGAIPFWNWFRSAKLAQAGMRGANAAVVGVLGAALYNPVFTSAVSSPRDFAFALSAFLLLTVWKCAPWIVVALSAATGIALAFV